MVFLVSCGAEEMRGENTAPLSPRRHSGPMQDRLAWRLFVLFLATRHAKQLFSNTGSSMCQYAPAMSKDNIQVKLNDCMPKELGIKHRRVIGRSKSPPVLSRQKTRRCLFRKGIEILISDGSNEALIGLSW